MELSPQVPALLMFRPDEERAQLISPPPGGQLPPLYRTQVMFHKKKIINKQRSDRTNQKYIFQRSFGLDTHTEPGGMNTPLSLAKFSETGSLPDVLYYWTLASKFNIKAQSEDQSHC